MTLKRQWEAQNVAVNHGAAGAPFDAATLGNTGHEVEKEVRFPGAVGRAAIAAEGSAMNAMAVGAIGVCIANRPDLGPCVADTGAEAVRVGCACRPGVRPADADSTVIALFAGIDEPISAGLS